MLCANADELPTHLYCVSHFSSSSRVRETNKALLTRPVPKAERAARGSSSSHKAPQLCQGDVQLQLCTNTLTKKNHQCRSNAAQEAHRGGLTRTTNSVPDTAVPVSLRRERIKLPPLL